MTNGPSSSPPSTSVPAMAAPVTTVTAGTLIMDTYEIEKLINSGGMGEVYRGRNIHNGEPVAIKIVLPALAHDPKIVALFQKESTVLSRLSHEAIVRYHTFTIDRSIGRPCMVMEFVSGLPLGDRVEQGPMPLDEVKVMFRRVASGLDKAHRAGVVHRDLSPDNVILEEDSVDHAKLIDFGIAKSASFGGGTLLGGQFAGKFNWVAPEQLGAFGGLVDGRSDIYSLALVVAAASRGKVVAMGDSIVDAVGKRSGVPDLTGVDPELLPLLSYMLQPDPEKRPASMAAVIAALDNPALVPPLATSTAPQPLDPNRTIIGGALPVTPSQPPVGATSMPQGADWAVPPGAAASMPVAPRGTSAPTVISAQPPVTQGPLRLTPAIEAEDISPFGAPAAPVTPAQPMPAAPMAKKSGGGVLAVVGLLVVLGGGAGAYFGGVFDPKLTEQDAIEKTEAEALKAIEDARIAAEKAAAEALAKAEADKIAAASAEAAAKAAEEKATADAEAAERAKAAALAAEDAAAKAAAEAKAKAEDEALGKLTEEQAAAKAAEEAAAAKAAEEAAAAQAAAEAAAVAAAKQAADEAAAQAAEQAAAEAEALRKAEEDAAAKAAAEAADPALAQAGWLSRVVPSPCVRLAPAGGDGLTMAGFATATAPLETLAASYKTELGRDADIAPKLINESQCPVVDFVNRRQTDAAPPLTVRMADGNEVVKTDKRINGVIEGINGRPFLAFLVADGGGVTNMTQFVAVASDGTATFQFSLGMAKGAPPAPQMVLVMTTDEKVPELEAVPPGVSAKSLVPFMEVALKKNTGPMSLGLGFFRLEN